MPAKCNIGIRHEFTELTGSTELGSDKNSMLANQIYDVLANSPNFEIIDVHDVQEAANKGDVIIGIWKNLEPAGHGHIVMAVPSEDAGQTWGSWNNVKNTAESTIPYTMDTGFGKRWTKKTVSYSYGSDIQGKTLFYRYIGTFNPGAEQPDDAPVAASKTPAAKTASKPNPASAQSKQVAQSIAKTPLAYGGVGSMGYWIDRVVARKPKPGEDHDGIRIFHHRRPLRD